MRERFAAVALVTFAVLGAGASLVGCSRSTAAPSEPTAMASASVAAPAPAPATAAPSDGAAGKPFGDPCVGDAECAGGVCFHKRLKGPDAGKERRGANDAVEHDGYCSLRCNDDADCPVPLTKGRCGARGMCKRAE